LERDSEKAWRLTNGYWRETLHKGSPREKTKDCEWTASLVVRGEEEEDELD
jgi:hypothetical protein